MQANAADWGVTGDLRATSPSLHVRWPQPLIPSGLPSRVVFRLWSGTGLGFLSDLPFSRDAGPRPGSFAFWRHLKTPGDVL